jgi:hypothetical protein
MKEADCQLPALSTCRLTRTGQAGNRQDKLTMDGLDVEKDG